MRDNGQSRDPERAFAERISRNSDGCWLWTGSDAPGGYGIFYSKRLGYKRGILAHRASWIIHRDKIPMGIKVCHRCDNPRCVNPDHLFLGTQNDNVQDCIKKGRFKGFPVTAVGAANVKAKLTEVDVREIRRLLATGKKPSEIATIFSVHKNSIENILYNVTWKHVA